MQNLLSKYFWNTAWIGGLLLGLLVGCDAEATREMLSEVFGEGAPQRLSTESDAFTRGTIRVASFNIQVFGTSKMGKPKVMDVLAETVRRFDVVAIQEIRSSDQSLLPKFVEQINAGGRRYDYVLGPRLGRTVSKEQYAFVYDTAVLEVDRDSVYTVPDPDDYLHREPLVARFRVRSDPPEDAFTFTLVNIHTDPDETDLELDALDDVFLDVLKDRHREDDVILLGDLNVDEKHLGELGRIAGIRYVVSGEKTNTRRTKSYDNILFLQTSTAEFADRWGVFDLEQEFNLTREQALDVSDHLPVWAEFDLHEASSVAGRRQPAVR